MFDDLGALFKVKPGDFPREKLSQWYFGLGAGLHCSLSALYFPLS